jgi:hypothetical protein
MSPRGLDSRAPALYNPAMEFESNPALVPERRNKVSRRIPGRGKENP